MEEAMVDGPSPTVWRRQLGMELRRLRDAAGKSQDDASQWVGVPATAISKMETGKQRVTQAYLRLLLQLYGVESPHSEVLEQLQRKSSQRGWWASYGKTVPRWFTTYIGMETVATEVWIYEAEYIPGLLQTPQYTEAITVASNPAITPDEVQGFVEVRTARQQRLTSDKPLFLRAVINEAALRREVGGPEVMRAQTRRLAQIAELPNVTVQVLPFSAGAHPGMYGSFTTLRFPEEPMSTVYVELNNNAIYLERNSEVDLYVNTFERLGRLALDRDHTRVLLEKIFRWNTQRGKRAATAAATPRTPPAQS